MPAFVYLLEEVPHKDGESGPWTKIGFSGNPPEWRIGANLTRGNPRHLTLGAVFEFETVREARDAERQAHEQFASVSHQKEWFAVHWQEIARWCDAPGWKRRLNAES
jgi:hypothetical protein